VLLSVKSFDSESAARDMAPHLSPGALLLSMQNGVENPAIISPLVPCAVMPAVVYVAAEMTAPNQVTHSGRGDLVIGAQPVANRPSTVTPAALADCFGAAGIPVRISDNIDGEAWEKLAMNCALNAISALARSQYGRIAGFEPTHSLMDEAVCEVDAVARAAGVRIPVDDLRLAASRLSAVMSRATSSTAQDIARGKRTEIDALNGYIARRGAELGVPTPINRALHALVRLLEQNRP
jgi:2-dehydropantoate 2-reductase